MIGPKRHKTHLRRMHSMKLHRTNLSFEHLTRAHSKQAIKFYDYESFENLDDPDDKKKK